jgi:hypothetical protein
MPKNIQIVSLNCNPSHFSHFIANYLRMLDIYHMFRMSHLINGLEKILILFYNDHYTLGIGTIC